MDKINIGFWNLGNLFDTSISSSIASDLEFTPQRGWDERAKEKKLENLARTINSLHKGKGPDLLGLCEIENEYMAQALIEKMGKKNIYAVAQYADSPDIRGIDTCLVYSKNVFRFNFAKSYNINFRYPTRDVFLVNLSVLQNNSEVTVVVNHWPSRGGGRFETEPLRIGVAENCARAVEDVVKVPIDELQRLPDDIRNNEAVLAKINNRWNRNVLVMGDFNDNPYDRSILNYLHATPDKHRLIDWKDLFEHPNLKRWPAGRQTDKHNYLFQHASLYNCMWNLIPEGTIFFDGGFDLFDQFIVSKGLLYGEQGLKMDLDATKIDESTKMINHVNQANFDSIGEGKIHPIYMKSPMEFVYVRRDHDGNVRNLPPGRDALTGFSDHFPIQSVLSILD
jgi:hypothetical protein